MKSLSSLLAPLLLLSVTRQNAVAQAVPKAVVAEHFTNTFCSICFDRNPGFYNNLAAFPGVLQLSFHPSSPYPSCPLNLYNSTDNDARAIYYGVYGATPKLVIQGIEVSGLADFNDPDLFESAMGDSSAYTVDLQLNTLSATEGESRMVIRKVSTSPLDSISVYAAIAEDTLEFEANNGESLHYNVFRKAIWDAYPVRIKAPDMIGDSIVMTTTFTIDAIWPSGRMFGIAIVQDADGSLIQAGRSGMIVLPSSIQEFSCTDLIIFPNPTTGSLYIQNWTGSFPVTATITDLQGRSVIRTYIPSPSFAVIVAPLVAGYYNISLTDGTHLSRSGFVKQ